MLYSENRETIIFTIDTHATEPSRNWNVCADLNTPRQLPLINHNPADRSRDAVPSPLKSAASGADVVPVRRAQLIRTTSNSRGASSTSQPSFPFAAPRDFRPLSRICISSTAGSAEEQIQCRAANILLGQKVLISRTSTARRGTRLLKLIPR